MTFDKLGINIAKERKRNGLTQEMLAVKLSVSKQTISYWERNEKQPRGKQLAKMADLFGVSISYLLTGEDETYIDKVTNIMKELNKDNQREVFEYTSNKLKEQQNTISDNVVDIQEYLYPVTTINVAKGGKGYFYGDNDNNIRYTNKLLNAYDFALDVVGDSMADKINDGDVVCVRKDYDFTNGAIYVVDVDGESLIKKVYDSFDSLMLRSINKEYDDIVVHKSDNVRIIGAVVDCFTPVK